MFLFYTLWLLLTENVHASIQNSSPYKRNRSITWVYESYEKEREGKTKKSHHENENECIPQFTSLSSACFVGIKETKALHWLWVWALGSIYDQLVDSELITNFPPIPWILVFSNFRNIIVNSIIILQPCMINPNFTFWTCIYTLLFISFVSHAYMPKCAYGFATLKTCQVTKTPWEKLNLGRKINRAQCTKTTSSRTWSHDTPLELTW